MKKTAKTSKAELTFNEFVGIDARGSRVHFGHACIYRAGDVYVMEGKTGRHTLQRVATDLDRLNAHWIAFAERNAYNDR
ncbi:hypothetical protein [Rhizobium phage RHph_X2_26]|nr:hypothetical protein [Rhizobium phage RHph_X2_26]